MYKSLLINTDEKTKELIALYKADFKRIDSEERYKWIAVKHFQENWDINASDFSDMLGRAFSKHVNLLDSGVARPLSNMVFFAKREPETVRSLFKTLYDESIPLEQRISDFTNGVDLFVTKMNQEDTQWKSSFQDQHAISVYLTFRYPENYYIYKYSILKSVAPLLGFISTSDRMITYREMCDDIRKVAVSDKDLIAMNHNRLGDDCYKDPENRMLAMDIAWFAYKQQQIKEEEQKLAARPAIVLDFKTWLEFPKRKNGKKYDYKTVKLYINQIENETKKLIPLYEGNFDLFTYDSIASFQPEYKRLNQIIETDDTLVNGAFPKVLRLYEQFLKEREQPSVQLQQASQETANNIKAYNRLKFLDEVFLATDEYDSLIDLLNRKKNIILQGAPGVGKTFTALRLAYSLIGEETSERICFVQFHQSYGYEDFVMGFRPKDDGFEMKYGAFYTFCKKAEADYDNDWYFIIDEINRGNISKIFGELLVLIEADKRNKKYAIRLREDDAPFYVPDNVYIIGMMNTADRSIALIDHALRRRFAFFHLEPAFDSESFRDYMENKNNGQYNAIIKLVSELNDEIAADPLLGPGYKVGHSYFCTDEPISSKLLKYIILYEIKPLLSEYWVDDLEKVKQWTSRLLKEVQ